MTEIKLKVREPNKPEREVVLVDGATVGRADGNGLKLADQAVSRSHLRLLRDNERWFVEDSGSASGTVVDGGKALKKGERAPLRHGSRVRVGDTDLEVVLEVETVEGRTVPGVNLKGGAAQEQFEVPDLTVPAPLPGKRGVAPRPAAANADALAPGAAAQGAASPGARVPAPKQRAPEPRQPGPEPEAKQEPDARAPGMTRPVDTGEQRQLALRPQLLARNARLLLVGTGVRRSVNIENTPFLIGRAERAAVMLLDTSISNEHAELWFDDAKGFLVVDRGSRNGTFVGAEKIAPDTPRALVLPAWLRFGTVDGWLVDDTTASAARRRHDRAVCDTLVRTGRLTPADKNQAVHAASSGHRHVSETILQQSRLSVAEWADALQRTPPPAAIGVRLMVLALVVAAVLAAVYWTLWRT
jgi:pSer/pThr/pTyr-binding forkhead associated (FHA) protein